jgi:NTE family protein
MTMIDGGVRLRLWSERRLHPIKWTELGSLDWDGFGVVLGAGGATGGAFECGVLLALETDHRVFARDASAWVGTSAGSIGATLLSLGFSAADMAAVMSRQDGHLSSELSALGVQFDSDVPPMPLWRVWRYPSPFVLTRAATLMAQRRFTALVLHLMRTGNHDLTDALHFLDGVPWPEPHGRLRLCATDVANGKRVVLDGSLSLSVRDAVAASCAVPGLMRPVADGRIKLVDGGMVSPTNLDLFAAAGSPRLILAVSPMSGATARSAAGRVSSSYSANRLDRELRALRPDQQVVVIEQSGDLSAAVVDDALNQNASMQILASTFVLSSAVAKLAGGKDRRRRVSAR